MSRSIGNYITCGILAFVFILFLPVILLPLLLVLFIQMLTGRRIVYMNRFRPGAGMHPRPPGSRSGTGARSAGERSGNRRGSCRSAG